VTRRLMALAPAVWEGRAELAGVTGVCCVSPAHALAERLTPGTVPVLVVQAMDPAAVLVPDAVVDARMRKRREPPVQIREAALTLGIGPGFICGRHVHGLVESNWGPDLGKVHWSGGSDAYTGRHREVGGYGRERYGYAPHAGRFRAASALLQGVRAGDILGWVDNTPLRAEIAGVLRGVAYDGVAVSSGMKLVEVDPTMDPARSIGIGERPAAIARGVLAALEERLGPARRAS
jgi:xanthine dehydrogenase accessory factor